MRAIDLDLEVEARKPGDPERGPVRVGRAFENLALHRHDGVKLLLGVGVERRDVDDVIEPAACGEQRGLEIGKGQPHLGFEIGLDRTVGMRADLTRYEQEIVPIAQQRSTRSLRKVHFGRRGKWLHAGSYRRPLLSATNAPSPVLLRQSGTNAGNHIRLRILKHGHPVAPSTHIRLRIRTERSHWLQSAAPKPWQKTVIKLIGAARKAFAVSGFAEASMDALTAQVGLTRGALYHGFGDKKGLLAAVVAEVDGEMAARARQASASAESPWQRLMAEGEAYIAYGAGPGDPSDRLVGRTCFPRRPFDVAQPECLPERHEAGRSPI